MHSGKVPLTAPGRCCQTTFPVLTLYLSLTFFCKLLVYDELPVSEVVQYWTKIGGVSIDEIRPRLILGTGMKQGWFSGTRKKENLS